VPVTTLPPAGLCQKAFGPARYRSQRRTDSPQKQQNKAYQGGPADASDE